MNRKDRLYTSNTVHAYSTLARMCVNYQSTIGRHRRWPGRPAKTLLHASVGQKGFRFAPALAGLKSPFFRKGWQQGSLQKVRLQPKTKPKTMTSKPKTMTCIQVMADPPKVKRDLPKVRVAKRPSAHQGLSHAKVNDELSNSSQQKL